MNALKTLKELTIDPIEAVAEAVAMATRPRTPETVFPEGTATDDGYTIQGFKISTRKLPILKAGPIEDMTKKLGIAPPEMIFGDNFARIEHTRSGWWIEFNAFDALDGVDKTGEKMLSVAYSKEWQRSRQHHYTDKVDVVKPFDWSYSTDYKGTVPPRHPHPETPSSTPRPPHPAFAPSTTPIPLNLLKRPDPILFFDEVILYEDELADNGISMMSVKVRVMPARLLLLCRFFMRLDDVVFRIRDSRVYVDFRTGEVLREYCAREEKFGAVREKALAGGMRDDVQSLMRDPNRLVEFLPIVERTMERLVVE